MTKNVALLMSEYGGSKVGGYPHSRDILPLLRSILSLGHQIKQCYPDYPKTGLIQKWFANEEIRKTNLQEHFVLGVQPHDEIFWPEADMVLMYAIPWASRNTDYIISGLQKYAEAGIPIVYVCADFEIENTKAGKSVVLDIIREQHPDVWNAITHVFTCIPHYPQVIPDKYGKPCSYLPTMYDSYFEKDIKPLSQREHNLVFGGPVGFRRNLFDNMDKIVNASDRTTMFFNESEKEVSKSRGNQPVNVREVYGEFPNVMIMPKGLFMSYSGYLEFLGNSVFACGDSTFNEYGIDSSNNMHTTRPLDGLYAGCWPMLTTTHTINKYMEDPYLVNIESTSESVFKDLAALEDSEFTATILDLRSKMKDAFGVERWVEVFYRNAPVEL